MHRSIKKPDLNHLREDLTVAKSNPSEPHLTRTAPHFGLSSTRVAGIRERNKFFGAPFDSVNSLRSCRRASLSSKEILQQTFATMLSHLVLLTQNCKHARKRKMSHHNIHRRKFQTSIGLQKTSLSTEHFHGGPQQSLCTVSICPQLLESQKIHQEDAWESDIHNPRSPICSADLTVARTRFDTPSAARLWLRHFPHTLSESRPIEYGPFIYLIDRKRDFELVPVGLTVAKTESGT
jgi:hypothetical protein